MCVIVHQPTGTHIDKETARKLWKTNPDGGGFAFVDDNKNLVVEKSMEFKDFWRRFETARSTNPGRDFLLHMRIATHGSVNINNAHPFQVDEHTVMAHNGILHNVAHEMDKTDDRTDSQYFVDEVLPALPETWLDNKYLRSMVEEWMGWSKLMFVTTNPKLEKSVYLLGEWKEHEGLNLSNKSGLEPAFKTTKIGGGWTPTAKGTSIPATSMKWSESSEDWTAWTQYQQSYLNPNIEDGLDLDTWEFDLLLDALKQERASMAIMHPLVVIDDEKPQIECTGCLVEIDIETAECGCWDKVCGNCWRFMANCLEEPNCMAQGIYDFDALTKDGQQHVNRINTTTQPQLQLVSDTGAEAETRNTA